MGFVNQATAGPGGRHTNAAKQPAARASNHDQTQWPMMRKAPAGIWGLGVGAPNTNSVSHSSKLEMLENVRLFAVSVPVYRGEPSGS